MYDYAKERPTLFTESGQLTFLAIRDRVRALLAQAGACTIGAAIKQTSGDSFTMLAAIDRLEELGETTILRTGLTADWIIAKPGVSDTTLRHFEKERDEARAERDEAVAELRKLTEEARRLREIVRAFHDARVKSLQGELDTLRGANKGLGLLLQKKEKELSETAKERDAIDAQADLLATKVRELQAHRGDPCIYCGLAMAEVPVGPCSVTREALAAQVTRLKERNGPKSDAWCLDSLRGWLGFHPCASGEDVKNRIMALLRELYALRAAEGGS